ncbi:uncharacterized protein BDCG_16256 [Blastomyces dermatitidis ER-3]|uniref:Uncharacterized protein n=1 Tax=Ajellomyces dermatitidis (strain ER-3 / ATCC MYA-2586) TaxID=559297 RepID=A0ABX2VR45_AJEDR|nr:uncharacterized protein BDCG_16256 [Blastomyces dermatitidis ER-3]OAS99677.1 hypothetical protein BDCG_16256 [Blastomyces dermatitidis ER-3]
MRRLTAKKRTALLRVRDWSEKDRELTADLKIECDDEAEGDEDTVIDNSVPASSADKKQSEKS